MVRTAVQSFDGQDPCALQVPGPIPKVRRCLAARAFQWVPSCKFQIAQTRSNHVLVRWKVYIPDLRHVEIDGNCMRPNHMHAHIHTYTIVELVFLERLAMSSQMARIMGGLAIWMGEGS